MRVLFLERGSVWIYGLPNGFRDAGHEVMVSGPLTNESIPELVAKFNPDFVFTIGWGHENDTVAKQEMLNRQISAAKVPHVYWATEDPFYTESFTLVYLKRVQPDFVFTICPEKVEYYERLGINAAYLDFGYHPFVHSPVEVKKEYRTTIALVASGYPHIHDAYPAHFRFQSLKLLIRPLLEKNIRVDFYGLDWEKMGPILGYNIPVEWIHGFLPYTSANRVYSAADIVIGLQNSQSQLTQRTYEILASGGVLLTDDSPGVRKKFVPERDLVVTSSPKETLDKVEYYLAHPEKRTQISSQGQLAVASYHYRYHAEYLIKVLKEKDFFTGKKSCYRLDLIDQILYEQNNKGCYIVRHGDNVESIAARFQISLDQLRTWNKLPTNLHYLFPGKELLIAKSGSQKCF